MARPETGRSSRAPVSTPPATAQPHPIRRPLSDPPGGMLMWIVVALELAAFGIIFVFIALLRRGDPAMFRAGQAALDPWMGLGLTVVLVTSGWLTAEAVRAFRLGALVRSRRLYGAAIVSGLGFVVLKLVDYASKLTSGHTLGVNDFWDAYLLGTGFHFAHVLVGLGLLTSVALRVGRTRFEDDETAIAGTALFWHMCDIAWFFLFPLFFMRA